MHSLAPDDPEVLEFETEVTAVDGRDVTLAETYFYAESGGQPADRGVLDGTRVADAQGRDGAVVHTLESDPEVAVGDAVQGSIDAAFRTYCRRAHTASHVLFGAGRRVLEDVGYGGFDIDPEKVRVDFTSATEITDEVLVELERLANRAVWDSLPVTWEYEDVATAREREEVAFNTRTEEGVMSEADEVRIVTVEGWDVAACGGTHVSNTREIGPVQVLDRSNPGEGLTRVEFAVGPVGIDRSAEVHRATRDAARDLGVAVEDLPDAVARIQSERDDIEREVRDLRSEVVEARLADLAKLERDGRTWLVGEVEGFGPNEVGDPLKELVGEDVDVVAVTGTSGATYVVVASNGEVTAGDVVEDVTAEFGGGGGGGPTFAQGGGIQAPPGDVVGYLRE